MIEVVSKRRDRDAKQQHRIGENEFRGNDILDKNIGEEL